LFLGGVVLVPDVLLDVQHLEVVAHNLQGRMQCREVALMKLATPEKNEIVVWDRGQLDVFAVSVI
jgi:hypothetical protein